MQIDSLMLNGVVIPREEGLELCKKYVRDAMTLECLFGGVAINIPEGTLQANVSLA